MLAFAHTTLFDAGILTQGVNSLPQDVWEVYGMWNRLHLILHVRGHDLQLTSYRKVLHILRMGQGSYHKHWLRNSRLYHKEQLRAFRSRSISYRRGADLRHDLGRYVSAAFDPSIAGMLLA